MAIYLRVANDISKTYVANYSLIINLSEFHNRQFRTYSLYLTVLRQSLHQMLLASRHLQLRTLYLSQQHVSAAVVGSSQEVEEDPQTCTPTRAHAPWNIKTKICTSQYSSWSHHACGKCLLDENDYSTTLSPTDVWECQLMFFLSSPSFPFWPYFILPHV